MFVGCLGCTPHVHQDTPSSFASDFASFRAASSVVSELHRSPQDGCLFVVLRLYFCIFLVCHSLHFYLSVQNCTLNLCFSCSESEVHPLPLLTFSFLGGGGMGLLVGFKTQYSRGFEEMCLFLPFIFSSSLAHFCSPSSSAFYSLTAGLP